MIGAVVVGTLARVYLGKQHSHWRECCVILQIFPPMFFTSCDRKYILVIEYDLEVAQLVIATRFDILTYY